MTTSLEGLLGSADVDVARTLEKPLQGRDLSEEEIVQLFSANGPNLLALLTAADRLRQEIVGDLVTYVINRNINFTNVCVKRCSFCAFSRTYRSDEGYYLAIDEIVRRDRKSVV